jgi:hypothetical protein
MIIFVDFNTCTHVVFQNLIHVRIFLYKCTQACANSSDVRTRNTNDFHTHVYIYIHTPLTQMIFTHTCIYTYTLLSHKWFSHTCVYTYTLLTHKWFSHTHGYPHTRMHASIPTPTPHSILIWSLNTKITANRPHINTNKKVDATHTHTQCVQYEEEDTCVCSLNTNDQLWAQY